MLSLSSRAHDQARKRQLYARGGMQEYWIVDPKQRVIEVIDGRGVSVCRVDASGEPAPRSPLLGALVIPLDEVIPDLDELPA